MKRVPLPCVPSLLLKRKLTTQPLSYKRVYDAAVSARIPAEREPSGRWSVEETDLPLIAETLCGAIAA
jgi:hypothetical protein